MKIAHYSYSKVGGAGVVAQLLSRQMNSLEHESEHVFQVKASLRSDPFSDVSTLFRSLADNYIIRKAGVGSFFSVLRSQSSLPTKIIEKDIIHLHWWQGLDVQSLRKNNPSAKFFVSLHDDRSFSGGCHSAGNCQGPLRQCSQCPMSRRMFWPLIESNFQGSRELLSAISPITFVAPNDWIRGRAEAFGLAKVGTFVTIPNPIDPIFDSQKYAVNPGRPKNLTFGFIAQNPTDSNKRLSLAIQTVRAIRERGLSATLDVVGGKHENSDGFVRFVGEQKPENLVKLAKNWSALLLTSQQETSPLVIAEMAGLGIPTASVELGGSKTLLSHLGLPPSVDLESEGMETFVTLATSLATDFGQAQRKTLSSRARRNFSLESVSRKLLTEYESGLKSEISETR